MGKPDFKSPRVRNPLVKSKTLLRLKGPVQRSTANVKVVVRVRPPNDREQGDNNRHIIKVVDDKVLIFDPKVASQAFFYHGIEQKGRDLLRKANKDLQFMFDKVFGYESLNAEIFENTTKKLITCLMDGCNCSVFAYGATGAGKTHTMLGHNSNPGITYLTMAELFKAKENLSSERNFELGISYIEVYNENVQDLLNPGPPLQLRDDGRYGVMVSGIKIYKIENPDELFSLLEKGNSNRTQHPTDANKESSRSHAVFQVYITMEIKATREVRAAKLSMIDLAGSERGSATGYGGARFTEGANINKSLLALGNCINSLADGQKYIPYRDSKLTRLLKDSLGGNCQTIMIANVSPSSLTYDDTYNTLKYATRAKKIKSDVKKNVVNVELHAGEYVKIVEELKTELEKVKAQLREKKVVGREIDAKIGSELQTIVEERKQLLQKIHNIECSENTVMLRRHLKEETDARLSGIISDFEEKEATHQRLTSTVNRFCRQEDSFKNELTQMKLQKLELERKMDELIKNNPEVQSLAELESSKLSQFEAELQSELHQKRVSMQTEELKHRADVLEKTCKMLKSCYLQLHGYGFTTETMQQEYQNLIHEIQGKRNVTWDSQVDSGVSSTTSVSSTDVDIKPVKRKLNDENVKVMNDTYVMEAPQPKVKNCAGEIISKVSANKSPFPKRFKEVGLKEKRPILRNIRIGEKKILGKTDILKKRPVFKT